MTTEEEKLIGDPWTILPIKTRKYARECTEVVLSNRSLNGVKNFENFENLEALWLNNNKVYITNNLEIRNNI